MLSRQKIFGQNQINNRKSLYPPTTVKVRVRDLQIIVWTVCIYTCILGVGAILWDLIMI